MPRKRSSRIYLKRGRFYADFRDFADVGGQKEALIPPGSKHATQERSQAEKIAEDLLQELNRRREVIGDVAGARDLTRFGPYIEHHLALKAATSTITDQWLEAVEIHLDTARDFFGATTPLNKITTKRVSEYMIHLASRPSGRRASEGEIALLSPGSQRKYLNSLSNLFRRAVSEGFLPLGYNPVKAVMEKPSVENEEADWLEVDEAALLLYAAELYKPKREDLGVRCVYPLIATLLLTGGRLSEVLGLEVKDIHFERQTVTFRPKRRRRLKNRFSSRPVPLWPQLAEILRAYLTGPDRPTGTLLFPSPAGPESLIQDIRKILDELAHRAALGRTLRSKMFRHTYCAARLQTTDRGANVALYTVSQELGHNSSTMVQKIYGHVGRLRCRGEVVEYRVDQFRADRAAQIVELEQLSGERNAFAPNLKRRVPAPVEAAVLEAAAETPEMGSFRVAERLRSQGVSVSGSGVRWIWHRHGLARIEQRIAGARSRRIAGVIAELRLRKAS